MWPLSKRKWFSFPGSYSAQGGTWLSHVLCEQPYALPEHTSLSRELPTGNAKHRLLHGLPPHLSDSGLHNTCLHYLRILISRRWQCFQPCSCIVLNCHWIHHYGNRGQIPGSLPFQVSALLTNRLLLLIFFWSPISWIPFHPAAQLQQEGWRMPSSLSKPWPRCQSTSLGRR